MAWGGRSSPAGNQEGSQAPPVVPVGEPAICDEDQIAELFANIQSTTRVGLFRRKPTWCQGYLTSIDIHPGEMLDLDQLKQDWGGGEIQFRPMVSTARGMKWAPGGRTLRFTGPPREAGRELRSAAELGASDGGAPRQVASAAPVRQDGSFALIQMLLEQNQARDRQMAELMAELRATPRQSARPMGSMLEQLREFKAIQSELLGGEEEEGAPAPAAPVDPHTQALMIGLRMLEKKLDGPTPAKDRRTAPAAPVAPPPDAPPLASGWRLRPAGPPVAAQAPAPAPAPARPVKQASPARSKAQEIIAGFGELSPQERMDVAGQISLTLDPEEVRNWMANNLEPDEDDQEADVGT